MSFTASMRTLHLISEKQGLIPSMTSLVFSTPNALTKVPNWLIALYFTVQSSSLQRDTRGWKNCLLADVRANLPSYLHIFSLMSIFMSPSRVMTLLTRIFILSFLTVSRSFGRESIAVSLTWFSKSSRSYEKIYIIVLSVESFPNASANFGYIIANWLRTLQDLSWAIAIISGKVCCLFSSLVRIVAICGSDPRVIKRI